MRIAVSNDHAGAPMRDVVFDTLRRLGHEAVDFGADGKCPVDYPDYAVAAVRALARGEVDRAILICGSGIGMSIVANRILVYGVPWPRTFSLPK